MTTVAQIVKKAYRESNLISINASPTTAQQEEALELLNEIIPSTLAMEGAGPLIPFPLGQNNIEVPAAWPWGGSNTPAGEWWIPEQAQVVSNLTAPTQASLHPEPTDGARFGVVDPSGNLSTNNLTIKGNGRLIEGSTSIVLNEDNLSREWFYRADLGNWLRCTVLELEDEFPFPVEFEPMFYIMLAMRINPRHGRTMAPETQESLRRSSKLFKARYQIHRFVGSELTLRRLWVDRFYGYYSGDEANARFNSGYPFND